MNPSVTVIIATYHRPLLLARALESLRGQGGFLTGAIVVNNGGDAETASAALRSSPVPLTLLTPEENMGTAGGIAAGLRAGLSKQENSHFWILDDDATASPGALDALLAAMGNAGAQAASAMVTDSTGRVHWFPGPLPEPAWTIIRSGVTPQEFLSRCGMAPLRWNWATWASLLVSRKAIEAVGLPDERFWFQGSDIEYTLRLSTRFTCVLAPAAVCPHLPPPGGVDRRRSKELWALQNGAFIATRLSHGRRILRHLPGNVYRYWKRCCYSPAALARGISAVCFGAILGKTVRRQEFNPVRPGNPQT